MKITSCILLSVLLLAAAPSRAFADGANLMPPEEKEAPEMAPVQPAPTMVNTPPPVAPSYEPPQQSYQQYPPPQQPYCGPPGCYQGERPYYQGQSSYYQAPQSYYGYYPGNAVNRYSPLQTYAQRSVPWTGYNPRPYSLRPQFAYAPAGLVIPVELATSISTQVAHAGDYVAANISQNIPLRGLSYIPAGSQLTGEVTSAEGGRFFGRSGLLSMQFNQLRLPDGRSVPIQAHIVGNIAKYEQKNGEVRGEGWGTKAGAFALRTAIGAGTGAVLGTALGGIIGHGVGRGAWAGAAIGGGLGAVDDLVLRRGRNVLIRAGTPMQVHLDDPIEIPIEQVAQLPAELRPQAAARRHRNV